MPVGILYEGWPATSNNPVVFDETGTKVLFDGRDIIVHGLTLTPDNFVKWLKAANSENTLNPRGIARQLIDEHGRLHARLRRAPRTHGQELLGSAFRSSHTSKITTHTRLVRGVHQQALQAPRDS